jgi:hypothetical protein
LGYALSRTSDEIGLECEVGVGKVKKPILLVLSIAFVLSVAGVAFGLSSTSHGGTPTDVYMTQDPQVCQPSEDRIGTEQAQLVPTTVNVAQQSHLLAYFGGMWSGFEPDSTLVLWFEIKDANGVSELSPSFDVSKGLVHGSGTLMWTFDNVAPGTYTVQALAALFPQRGAFISHGNGANIQNCALTVFVNPVASP